MLDPLQERPPTALVHPAVGQTREGAAEAGQQHSGPVPVADVRRAHVRLADEATSPVGIRTEVLVQHAMSALRSDRTRFVIAHRLSTIRDAASTGEASHTAIAYRR
ncbi:hypothetical protein [Streptosporangium sp. NPDC004631]